MMKILSPAGDFLSLKLAVYNGADEVYLGIDNFNARNNIDGFSLNDLPSAVTFAHAYGVKVFLAINILFSDDEILDAVNTLISAYNVGVDAFIIQDLALAKIVSEKYPEIELHASTQMGVHNLEGVRFLEKYNFKRVVLSRETPLSEIKRIRENSQIEIEYFVQGALCVSFSGNCYMSSYLFSASGNRGRCKQPCRLSYSLKKGDKTLKTGYLLSAKDFCMIDRLADLERAGVTSLKIEGRARRPYYVATATREYYNALNGHEYKRENLELAFNRTYTEGYFNGNGDIISRIQNHVGLYIGKVLKVEKFKTFNKITISSNRILSPKSVLKIIRNGKEADTLSAFDLKAISLNKYDITTTHNLILGDDVHLISDYALEQAEKDLVKKAMVNVKLSLKENQPISAKFNLYGKEHQVVGSVLEKAKTRPLAKDEIELNFSKHPIFSASITFDDFDDVFLSKQLLNEFRRTVFDKIERVIFETFSRDKPSIDIKIEKGIDKFTDYRFIYQREKLSDYQEKNIIYSPDEYDEDDIAVFKSECDALGKNAYLDTPVFAVKEDVEVLNNIITKTGIGIVANNYYAMGLKGEKVVGGLLNVYNSVTAKELKGKVICAEGDYSDKFRAPAMTLLHCPMKCVLGGNCADCKYEKGYYYQSEDRRIFDLNRKKTSTCTFNITERKEKL